MISDSSGERPARIERVTGRLVQGGLGAGLVLTVGAVLVRPHDANVDYDQRVVVAAFLVALGGALVGGLAARRWVGRRASAREGGAHRRSSWLVAVAISLAGGVVGLLLARLVRYAYGWDAAVSTGFARELAATGQLSDYARDYLSRYPNNVPLIAVMRVCRWVGDLAGMTMYGAYLLLNALCLAAVLLLTFAIVRVMRGRRAGFVAQVVVLLLVGFSPWMAVPYTDFPAMPFVTGAALLAVLAVRAQGWRRAVLLAAGAFVLISVAYVIKSTPASSAVAFGVVGLVVALGRDWRGRSHLLGVLALGAAAFAVTAVTGLAASSAVADVPRSELDASRTAPAAWWLANGLTTTTSVSGRPYYGAYNPAMVNESMHLRGEALQNWSERRLSTQVSKMGADGIVAFEARKQTFNWGDGMFFAWGEGYDFEPKRLQDHSGLARDVQGWQHPSGPHYVLRASVTNGVWLALVLWAGVGLLVVRYRRDVAVLAMTVLGIAVFSLVFQGRSRYLFAYVPVIVALAACVDPLAALRRATTRQPATDG